MSKRRLENWSRRKAGCFAAALAIAEIRESHRTVMGVVGRRRLVAAQAFLILLISGLGFAQETPSKPVATAKPRTNAVAAASASATPTNGVPSVSVSTNALSINVTTNDLVATRLDARLTELAAAHALDPTLKVALTEAYQSILEQLRLAAEAQALEAQFTRQRAEAPAEILRIRKAMEEAKAVLPVEADRSRSVSDLQAMLGKYETELSVARGRLSEFLNEPQKRADRRSELSNQLADLRANLEQTIAVEGRTNEPAELTGARKLERLAQRRALTAQIAADSQEIGYYDATKDLLAAQIDQANSQVTALAKQVEAWRTSINQRRSIERQAGVAEASATRREALALSQNHELVVKIADENDRLMALRVGARGLDERIETTANQFTKAKADLKSLQDTFGRISERIRMLENANVRLDKSIALLLRRELLQLRYYEVPQADRDLLENEISTTLSQMVRFQEDRFQLTDVGKQAKELVAEHLSRAGGGAGASVETAVRMLLETRRNYLDSLIADSNLLLTQLISLKTASRELYKTAHDFRTFIRERILWIPSTSPWSLQGFLDASARLGKALPKQGWISVSETLVQDFSKNALLYVLVVLMFLALLGGRKRLEVRLSHLCELAKDPTETSFLITLRALFMVTLLSLTWNLWLLFLGWRLSMYGSASFVEFTWSLGNSLMRLGLTFWLLQFFRVLCRPGGVGEAHFGWLAHNTRVTRDNFLWYMLALLPVRLTADVVLWNMDQVRHLEQSVFTLIMLLALIFAYRMLHPVRGLQFEMVTPRAADAPRVNLRFWLYVAAILLPLALAVTALRGYYYSAWAIALHVGATIRLLILLYLGRAVLFRWLLVSRRRMAAREGERRQREKLEAEATGRMVPAVPPGKISLVEIIQQSQQLVRTGMLLIFVLGMFATWGDFIPALHALDRVPLTFWSQEPPPRESEGAGPTPARTTPASSASTADPSSASSSAGSGPSVPGASSSDSLLRVVSGPPATEGGNSASSIGMGTGASALEGGITMADLLWVILTLAITVVAVRNLPGLLQVLLLNRVRLQPGVDYAITTVIRYSLMIVCALIISARLGISWSKVQWIVAAFSLGIAFGLQEIFANFISGLIILFERPVRVGDIVTVGDVSGNVTRINIRATTIMDWDHREFLVPNKEFITGKLLNWTLTDPVTRVLVEVGIAYGSDTDLAEKLLLEAARENPYVMSDPPPRAIFWGFGDNALQFRLYVHIPRRNFYFELLHGLTTRINRKFKEAGITIAFPQRDVHLDQAGPIKIELLPNPTSPAAHKTDSAPQNPTT